MPRKGVNKRDLDPKRSIDSKKQKIAYYNADAMPPPNSHGVAYVPDRKAAIAAAAVFETPEQARERVRAGGAKPKHYVPTPPIPVSELEVSDTSAFDPYSGTGSRGRSEGGLRNAISALPSGVGSD